MRPRQYRVSYGSLFCYSSLTTLFSRQYIILMSGLAALQMMKGNKESGANGGIDGADAISMVLLCIESRKLQSSTPIT